MQATWERAVDLGANAPPFERNPSAWRQRIPIALLAGVGTIISAYLALFQWGLVDSIWDPVFGDGSERVLTSELAHRIDRAIRMPDAALGAWAYLSEVAFTLIGSTRRWQFRPWMVVLFGFDVIPLGFVSAALVLAQGAVLLLAEGAARAPARGADCALVDRVWVPRRRISLRAGVPELHADRAHAGPLRHCPARLQRTAPQVAAAL